MDINQLYQFVLLIVLVGMISGVGVLILDKFASSSGVSVAAATALNASRDAVAEIPNTWLSLIVTVGILAVILFFVIRSFGGALQGGR